MYKKIFIVCLLMFLLIPTIAVQANSEIVSGVSSEPSNNLTPNESTLSFIAKEQNYLNSIRSIANDIKKYGVLYLKTDQNTLVPGFNKKFIFSYSNQSLKDDNLNRIISHLKSSIPAELLEIKETSGPLYPSSKLYEVNQDIFAHWKEYTKAGANIIATYTDEELDKVVIEATSISESARTMLENAYGDVIDIRVNKDFKEGQNSISRTGNNLVLGGGIAINNSNCTVTATAKRNSERYIITAAHCLSSLGDGITEVDQNTTKVGVEWATSGNGQDIGLIKVTESGRQISNGVIKYSTTSYDGSITATGTVFQGESVCKSGITTGYTCSTVTSTSFTPTISGVVRPDQIKIANPNYGFQYYGDSGSPLLSLQTLLGIMSGISNVTGEDAWASATKISYFGEYFSDYSIYLSNTPY